MSVSWWRPWRGTIPTPRRKINDIPDRIRLEEIELKRKSPPQRESGLSAAKIERLRVEASSLLRQALNAGKLVSMGEKFTISIESKPTRNVNDYLFLALCVALQLEDDNGPIGFVISVNDKLTFVRVY
jgi:hypothetical protein